MKLVWLVLFILYFKESQSEIRTYNSPWSGLSFLCGCASATQYNTTLPILCTDDKVIQMEPYGYLMRNSARNSKYCGYLNYTTCKNNFRPTVVSLEDRIEVYKKCSLQNSCDIKIAGEQEDKQGLVNYPFYCHSVQSVHNLSAKVTKSNFPIFYFTGEKYKGKHIDCDCSARSPAPIRLEIFFFHLIPHTCSKVKFLSETHQLFGCSTNGITMLYNRYFNIGTDFKLEIRGMEPDVEDVLFFRLWGSDMTVNCGECTKSKDDGLATTSKYSIDTTTRLPATNTSPIDPTTTDLPTTRSLATYSSTTDPTTTVNSTVESPASAASTDQTNNVATATLGGILAAVIIINIVGIALYCFIRRRRKQQKIPSTLSKASKNGEESQYNYIDMTLDTKESSSTNRTEGYVVQNGDQRKHQEVNALDNIPKTSGSKDQPNNQYHVLEVDSYSAPASTHSDAQHKRGNKRRKQDDYDHINDGTKSKPTNIDNYNHIDATMAIPRDATPNTITPYDDYNHIGDQNGLSKHKLKLVGVAHKKQERKQKNQVSGNENTSYVNVNLEPDDTPSSTEDVDTYNHLQN